MYVALAVPWKIRAIVAKQKHTGDIGISVEGHNMCVLWYCEIT